MSVPHGTVSAADHNEKWAEPLKPIPDKVDWTVQAVNGAHIWHDTNTSGGCMLQDCKVCWKLSLKFYKFKGF